MKFRCVTDHPNAIDGRRSISRFFVAEPARAHRSRPQDEARFGREPIAAGVYGGARAPGKNPHRARSRSGSRPITHRADPGSHRCPQSPERHRTAPARTLERTRKDAGKTQEGTGRAQLGTASARNGPADGQTRLRSARRSAASHVRRRMCRAGLCSAEMTRREGGPRAPVRRAVMRGPDFSRDARARDSRRTASRSAARRCARTRRRGVRRGTARAEAHRRCTPG